MLNNTCCHDANNIKKPNNHELITERDMQSAEKPYSLHYISVPVCNQLFNYSFNLQCKLSKSKQCL